MPGRLATRTRVGHTDGMAAESSELHDRILTAGLDLFRKKGYDNTSVADICADAGVSEDEFHSVFDAKIDILHEYVAALSVLLAEMTPKTKAADTSVQATIQALVREIAEAIEADRALMAEVWPRGVFFSTDPKVKAGFRQMYERWEQIFTDGQTAGEIHHARDPRQLTEMMLGIAYVTIVNWLIEWWDEPGHLGLRLSRAADQFMHGAGSH